MNTGEIARILRFGCVGLLGVAVNSALLWVLTERGHLYYLVSSIVATEVAILVNFALNHRWTFAAFRDEKPLLERLVTFNVVSLTGLALTVSMLFVLKQFAGLQYMLANTVAVGLTATWNYVLNRHWTWRGAAAGRA